MTLQSLFGVIADASHYAPFTGRDKFGRCEMFDEL
jgi:hypothetical protein